MPIDATITLVRETRISNAMAKRLVALTQEAVDRWSAVLAGSATANVSLFVHDGPGRATGGNRTSAWIGTFEGRNVYEPGTAYELRTGAELGQAGADIAITMPIDYLTNQLFLDRTPNTARDIPRDRVDALSVLMHEIGHALGFIGYYNEAADTFYSNANTPYDTHLTLRDGQVFFDGANVRRFYGDAIPLSDNNYAHYGNSSAHPDGGDPLTGLMNGIVYYTGHRYEIGALDLAVLADNGIGTIGDDIFTIGLMRAFNGGAGRDMADFSGIATNVTVSLAIAEDQETGGAGVVRLVDIEDVTGSSVADTLTGNRLANAIRGGAGPDRIDGGGGNDLIVGGLHADTLTGGAGADIFRISAGDLTRRADAMERITDFSVAQGDRIDLTGYDAIADTAARDRFDFVGRAAFSGTAGELRYEWSGGATIVSGDTDGDRTADLLLALDGRVKLSARAFDLGTSAPAGAAAPESILPDAILADVAFRADAAGWDRLWAILPVDGAVPA